VLTVQKQVVQNENLKCGNTGDRWSTVWGDHLGWCMRLAPADRHYVRDEIAARDQAIKNCTGIMYEKPPADVLKMQKKPEKPFETYKDRDVQKKPSGIKPKPREGTKF
jgi:hypothetical protein